MRKLLFVLLLLGINNAAAQEASVIPIPERSLLEAVQKASLGCMDCHTKTDAPSMHQNPAVHIGCTDCHGGDSNVRANSLTPGTPEYSTQMRLAHIQPKFPELWPSSANPERPYTASLKESWEFIKFINPGDLRVARQSCGGCHAKIVESVEKSIMTTSAMLWGGGSYNNNILPYKRYVLGESYGMDGRPRSLSDPELTDAIKARGGLQKLIPLPQWEVIPPGDIFRVFERGGQFIKSQFPEIGVPNPLEEPGKPDVRASNRGPGTGNRISVPVINIHKTRLNDPHLSMMGTNDHPGDFRSSGCTACHSIYANDRDVKHSGSYAQYGHRGLSISVDPTIPKNEKGHPLRHEFTRAIPTSQCMVCHMHQPDMFVNTYLGYTMWDYEADAPAMWPKQQRYPSIEESFKSLEHNPEEAATRGLWTDTDFLEKVSELNPKLKSTQFADYHGHGWNFRAVYKRDRRGNLLDAKSRVVKDTDPHKFKKAVHLSDIHLDKGMHCVDCHFAQDSHGDGHIYGEVAQAVQIQCQDCHGSIKSVTNLRTSGPAAPKGGEDMSLMRNPWGERLFDWKEGLLYQRSNVTKGLEWVVKQVRDTVDPKSAAYNPKAARAKLMGRFVGNEKLPQLQSLPLPSLTDISASTDSTKLLAHSDEKMACYTCHTSWTTACAGCHLPIQANWKQKSKHYDGKTTRNWASYNPQIARDDMFQLGLHGPAKDGKIVPVRSSSALVLSSSDINRQKIYIQQPPIAASGHSSQAFAPHFPHTVRTTETKGCTDCHISEANDNNAIMAQLLLLGTNFVNFVGANAWLGIGEGGVEAVQVTEWDEPQAVIGSYLQRYAYPDFFKTHEDRGRELQSSYSHASEGGVTNTVQLRGEYLYTTSGTGGFRVYDVANIANKGFSERITTSPVSPLGQDLHVPSQNATGFELPTTMPIAPMRKALPENLEDKLHEIYHYAVIVDAVEGLILVNVDTLSDGDPQNNFLKRALTWNEGGVLTGARFVTLGGTNAYVLTETSLVILDLDKPLEPRMRARVSLGAPRAAALQFRYLFVTTEEGLVTVDVTELDRPRVVESSRRKLANAGKLYVARTYAYVACGAEGLAIVDIERPEKPELYQKFTADGQLSDVQDVKVASTNASLFAYVADGRNGLKVLQLTDPETVPGFYGFSPVVKPRLIAWKKTDGRAMSVSKGLDRDRAVDETGHQVSVFGRLGSRPFYLAEMQMLYLRPDGSVYTVRDAK